MRLVIGDADGGVVITVRVGQEGKSVGSILDVLSAGGLFGVLRSEGDVLTREDVVYPGEDVRFTPTAAFSQEEKSFISGSAIVLSAHYYVPWPDLDKLVKDLKSGRWLLLTAPWQSGKSSLLKGLSVQLQSAGYLVILTTLTAGMVAVANNRDKSELDAAKDFFNLLKSKVSRASRGWLSKVHSSDEPGIASMFQRDGKQIIWLVDEAQLLNEILHTTGLARRILLQDLRDCKQYCRPRDSEGSYWLCSFSLCGLPRLSGLIGDLRDQRIMEAGEVYQHSSPARSTAQYDLRRPMIGFPPSPLSMEVSKEDWNLEIQQISQMLREYAQDNDIRFRMKQGGSDDEKDEEEAVVSIAADIFSRTSGHKGMVGCCCEVLQWTQVTSLEGWLKLVRSGVVASHTFTSRCYSQLIRNIAFYSSKLKEVLLECIKSVDGSTTVDNLDTVLEALDDGVLVQRKDCVSVQFSSGLLLETLLESCLVAPMASMPPPTDSLLVAFEAAFTLMDPACFLRPKVLNATGQPSEYVMQSQLHLALKFVITNGIYTGCKYRVLVEVKERDENGHRRMRMDFFLENGTTPVQGIEVHEGGNAKSIQEHISRSDYYRALHECEMHYVYFWVGEEDNMDAKEVIMAEAREFPLVTCWYVQFSPKEAVWTIARVEKEQQQMFWHSVKKPAAPQFPQILLETAEPLRKKQRL